MQPDIAKELGRVIPVRGTDHGDIRPTPSGRVIPACAGNSMARDYRKARCAGHPCVCGEQTLLIWHAIKFSCQIQPL